MLDALSYSWIFKSKCFFFVIRSPVLVNWQSPILGSYLGKRLRDGDVISIDMWYFKEVSPTSLRKTLVGFQTGKSTLKWFIRISKEWFYNYMIKKNKFFKKRKIESIELARSQSKVVKLWGRLSFWSCSCYHIANTYPVKTKST